MDAPERKKTPEETIGARTTMSATRPKTRRTVRVVLEPKHTFPTNSRVPSAKGIMHKVRDHVGGHLRPLKVLRRPCRCRRRAARPTSARPRSGSKPTKPRTLPDPHGRDDGFRAPGACVKTPDIPAPEIRGSERFFRPPLREIGTVFDALKTCARLRGSNRRV